MNQHGMIQFGILGSNGRMGKWVCDLLQSEYSSKGAVKAKASQGEPLRSLLDTDVVIDFSSPAAVSSLVKLALNHSSSLPASPLPAFVIGSTGRSPQDQALLEELAQKTPVFVASNFSSGIAILSEILKKYAPILEKLGYSPVLVETHHQHKKDAPSGTALSLLKAMDPHHPDRIQTHSIRSGEVIGNHEIHFYGPAEQVQLGHFAQDRSIFARGAIEVALWIATQKTIRGMIGMEHYFKEKSREFNV